MKEQKVIKFPADTGFQDFLDRLSKEYEEKKIIDFVCIYNVSNSEDEASDIIDFWFGKNSTLNLLGLIEVMKGDILSYMANFMDDEE